MDYNPLYSWDKKDDPIISGEGCFNTIFGIIIIFVICITLYKCTMPIVGFVSTDDCPQLIVIKDKAFLYNDNPTIVGEVSKGTVLDNWGSDGFGNYNVNSFSTHIDAEDVQCLNKKEGN